MEDYYLQKIELMQEEISSVRKKYQNQKIFAYMVTHEMRMPMQTLLDTFKRTSNQLMGTISKLETLKE